MSDASKKIMAGDLSQRLPVGGSGDEFDRLSMSLNTMLERIEKLNEGLRQVSDNIAHDLKTPLTRLRNKAADALDIADGETRRTALEGIISESRPTDPHLQRAVDDLPRRGRIGRRRDVAGGAFGHRLR